MSTLCAGCGHDSVTGAIVQAAFELNIASAQGRKDERNRLLIEDPGVFSEPVTWFQHGSWSNALCRYGANAANSDLTYIGVSGDGDSLSIGLGQFCHAIRRNLNMLYVIENNGVYGLTKGQFSASADIGSTAKKGEANLQPPIDPCRTAISMGAAFVARSFSGDKEQLVPLLKAGLSHRGFSAIDVISPCVTFNDHEGSTKSYEYTRQHFHPAIATDYIQPSEEILTQYDEGDAMPVKLHDGSQIVLRKVKRDYDPTDRAYVYSFLERTPDGWRDHHRACCITTTGQKEMHDLSQIVDEPLATLDY